MTTTSADVPVIEIDRLVRRYGRTDAVNGLDLRVQPGRCYGFFGRNGAGKTTTAGMLTTRVIPTTGEAYVGGIDVVRHPAAAKHVIGVVPQTNTLDRSLTVWENLYFHGRYFGMDGKSAKRESSRLLEQFRLADRAKTSVNALSGGLAQRLMVARAIMHRPSIVFLDEPTSGLDPVGAAAFDELIRTLQRTLGLSVFMVTHDLDSLHAVCDRIAVMHKGEVVEEGSTAAVFAAPQHDYTRALFDSAPGRNFEFGKFDT